MPMLASIKTLGCRLNQAETAVFAGALGQFGISLSDREDNPCDVHIVHTCAITLAAERESQRAVRHARRVLGPSTLLVVAGCAVELPGAEAAFRDAGADLVIRRADKPRIAEIIAAALGSKSPPSKTGVAEASPSSPLPHSEKGSAALPPSSLLPPSERGVAAPSPGEVLRAAPMPSAAPPLPRFSTTRAILKVQDGCACRCSYCIVPSTRGAPQSRSFSETVAEADAVFRAGYREIVLTGVNIALYRDSGRSLRDLCADILDLPSRNGARLRLGSIEPGTSESDLVDFAASHDEVCRFFHFPLQSGSDRILRAMRRPYSAAQYAKLMEKTIEAMPHACLGADIITGFPGEDDDAFDETVRLVKQIPFGNLHVFPYSERPGTPAAAFPDSVPMHVRRERTRELVALGEAKRIAFAGQFVNRNVELLVERVSADGIGTGWSGEYLECRLPGCTPADVNTIKTVRVTATDRDTLLVQRG